jgi:hypothetical protein
MKDTRELEVLLSYGSDTTATAPDGKNALHLISIVGNSTPSLQTIEVILRASKDPLALLIQKDENGMTPLVLAR